MVGVADTEGSVYLLDGFYERELGIEEQAKRIKERRALYAATTFRQEELIVWADPQIAKHTNTGQRTVGDSVMEMFRQEGVWMQRANNDIANGILKVKDMLYVRQHSLNPFTNAYGCPSLFVADTMQFLRDEFATYRWKRGTHTDTPTDKPVDVNNHAMDTLRYMLSADAPRPIRKRTKPRELNVKLRKWHEQDFTTTVVDRRKHRYTT